MATYTIVFDLRQSPHVEGQADTGYFPVVAAAPVIRSDQLYEQISRSCTLTPADAKAFLSAPANVRFSHPSIHLYPAAPSLLHLLVYSSHSFSGRIIA